MELSDLRTSALIAAATMAADPPVRLALPSPIVAG